MSTETVTSEQIEDLDSLEAKVAQKRDELRVRMHLARADARDQWERLEIKWERFRARGKDLRGATGEAAEDLLKGLKALGHEIAEGYEAIRRAL